MGLVRDYIDYIRDNPEHYWFKRKLYGWGWDPATKEGWLMLAVFVILVMGNAFRLELLMLPESELIFYAVVQTGALVFILLAICVRTGEKPRWQWGVREGSLLFWDLMAKTYSRQAIADEASYAKKLEVTQTYFRPDSDVMEFGCGTGSTAIVHAPYVRHILATDGSAKMIEIARGKAVAQHIENITFECATIKDLELPPESKDVVLGLSILHLVDDRDAVIQKVYSMLKPGGVFVTSTICMGDMGKFVLIARLIAPFGWLVGLVLRVFTMEELKASMVRAGFKIDYEWRPGIDKAAFIVAKK
jgi:ubiquinone/menaquinone biosynthesis C-methylase UbiE